MVETSKMRKQVQAILDKHGFVNAFGIRTVDFTDLLRKRIKVVVIKGWKPNPKARLIKADIERKFADTIVEFH